MEPAKAQGIVKGDFLSRMAGGSFILGGLLLIVFNALLPRVIDPADMGSIIQKVADTRGGFWELDHLLIAAGLWAVMIGTAGIYRSITAGTAAVWARLGFYGVIVGTTLFSVTLGLAGPGLGGVVGSWAAASGADKAALFQAAIALGHFSAGMFSMTIIVYWLALAFVGMGIALSTVYPKWLGWVLVGLGVVTVAVVGVPLAISGPSQTLQVLLFILGTLSSLYALVLGVWIARKAF